MSQTRSTGLALGVWGLLVLAGWLVGTLLNDAGVEIMLDAPPFYGKWDVRLRGGLLAPVAVAAVVVAAAPRVRRDAPWPVLLLLVGLAAFAWDLSLALVDRPYEIVKPLTVKTQYIHVVHDIGSPLGFLQHFVERIDDYPAHVRAHPPAMVLGLWALDRIGLGGLWPAALLIVAVAASAGPAALIALRTLAGEAPARRAAPYLVLGAAALSVATTADALYMAVGAWGVTALVVAIDRRSAALAVAGGLLLGLALMCSYGLVLLALVPLPVAVARRRWGELALAAGGAAAVLALFAAAGFWWLDGFAATRHEYADSVAMTRPYWYFVFNNPAAFSVWLGPAVVVALTRLRDRRAWLLVGGGLAAIAVADLTGLSKAEVERIWLPFLPWIVLAAAALPDRPGVTRWLLGAQAATALLVAVNVSTLW